MADGEAAAALIRAGDLDGLRALLADAPELAGMRLTNGASLLATAVYAGQPDAVALIRDLHGPLNPFEACMLGDVALVQAALDKGWDPDGLAADGFTPLALAAFFHHHAVFDLLLPLTDDIDARASNPQYVAAIHAAAAAGETAMVEKLLLAGADANLVQSRNLTALHVAAARGNTALVELLLTHGANPKLADAGGKLAVDYATEQGHTDLSALLTR